MLLIKVDKLVPEHQAEHTVGEVQFQAQTVRNSHIVTDPLPTAQHPSRFSSSSSSSRVVVVIIIIISV